MKLMFVSNIRGPLPAAKRVLELFVQSGAQWLMILGNVLNHGPRNTLPEGYASAKVAKWLNEATHKVIVVRGNCDSEVDQILLHSPITASWQQALLEKRRLFSTHGHLPDLEDLPALDQNDALVYDHTHLLMVEQWGEIFHFNPGLVSILKGGNPASYGMLDNDVLSIIALND